MSRFFSGNLNYFGFALSDTVQYIRLLTLYLFMIDPNRHRRPLLPFALMVCLAAAGCTTTGERTLQRHRELREAQEAAAQRALDAAGDSLVLFKVEETGTQRERNRTASFSGIILSADGHLLAPYTIKPGSSNRIEAWIGDQRYLARPIKYDETIGMSIVKVEPRTPLVPVDLAHEYTLSPGQEAYTVVASDSNSEFSRFVFRAYCQGIIQGRYRQFSLSPLPGATRGAPLFTAEGELVGLVNQNNAWMLKDLFVDLSTLLARANGDASPEEDSEDAWFGALMSSINADYARSRDLPRSALWMVHVYEGGSADKAGLKNGDLLIELDGEPLRLSGTRAYQYFIQTLRPRKDKEFEVKVLRDGKELVLNGKITNKEKPDVLRAEDLGITISDIIETAVIRLNLFQTEGVMITKVDPGSPAATGRTFGQSLLRPRDVIVSLGGIPTPDIEAFGEALDTIRSEKRKELLVTFWRGPTTGYEALNLRIGDRDNGEQL